MKISIGSISFLFAISISSLLQAQVVFTEANALPPTGEIDCVLMEYSTSDPPTFVVEGTNVLWDFSQTPWTDQGTIAWNIQPTNWTGYEDDFTFSNKVYWQERPSGTRVYYFMELGPDSMLLSGDAFFVDSTYFGSSDWCPNRPVWLRFPAGVGSVVSWPEHECNGSLRTYEREIVASGSLDLGFAQFDDILLFRYTTTTITTTDISYHWYQLGDAFFSVLSFYAPIYYGSDCNSITTSLNEEIAASPFAIIPNPATDNFRAVWSERSGSARLTMLDTQGRQVLEAANLKNGSHEISVQGIANGTYLVLLDDDKGRRAQRIVVAH